MNNEFERALKKVGENIVELRKQCGWSQEQLALKSGLSQSYLSGIENGKRNLTLRVILRLAHTLEVPVGKILE